MNQYKKLALNSIVFTIANMGSKLIMFILVPFYTYMLTTDEYGTVDLFITIISLVIPITTMGIHEAAMRFAMKKEYNPKHVINNSFVAVFVGNIIFLLLSPIFIIFKVDIYYLIFIYLITFLNGVNTVLGQFLKGNDKTKLFALNGVLLSFFTLIFNILFLFFLHKGIEGYLLSLVFAYLVCNIYLIAKGNILSMINFKYLNIPLFKEMIIYSLPLIPNALMWWVMNTLNRFVILGFIGVQANGLYAVANKMPTIINTINNIFIQAWQLSAIEENDADNKNVFYGKIFNSYIIFTLFASSAIILVMREFIIIFLNPSYYEVWRYIPILLIATVFASFSSFLGTNYIVSQETKGAFKTSGMSAICNVILSLLLVKFWGLYGISIATLVSYVVLFLLRLIDSNRYIKISYNKKEIVTISVIIVIQFYVYYIRNIYISVAIQIVLFILIAIIAYRYFEKSIKKILYKLKKEIV